MLINITNGYLLMLDNEIRQMDGSILQFFFASKINEFYKRNGGRIATILQKRKELWNEFLQFDEDGKLKVEGEGKDQKLVLKEEIRRKEFEDKMTELMNKEVSVDV